MGFILDTRYYSINPSMLEISGMVPFNEEIQNKESFDKYRFAIDRDVSALPKIDVNTDFLRMAQAERAKVDESILAFANADKSAKLQETLQPPVFKGRVDR